MVKTGRTVYNNKKKTYECLIPPILMTFTLVIREKEFSGIQLLIDYGTRYDRTFYYVSKFSKIEVTQIVKMHILCRVYKFSNFILKIHRTFCIACRSFCSSLHLAVCPVAGPLVCYNLVHLIPNMVLSFNKFLLVNCFLN